MQEKSKRKTKKSSIKSAYIPMRLIFAALIIIAEVLAVIGIVIALCIYVPYFIVFTLLTQIVCVLRIIASDDNPDYKVPWLLVVLIFPVAGFMVYFMFYSRKLKDKHIKRLDELKKKTYSKNDKRDFLRLKEEDSIIHGHAKMICELADTHLFGGQGLKYFSSGEELFENLINDLKIAEKFIFMEYFIIDEGELWNSILQILVDKAKNGVEIKIVYDDVGCIRTLPGNYYKRLKKYGIEAVPFSRLKGQADNEFNNRSHRKITVIDGKIGYTGGANIADEYVNKIERFGHWKDSGIRIEGEAVWELTELFLTDYCVNVSKFAESDNEYYPSFDLKKNDGYVIPFGDGPNPLYPRRVSKNIIINMLSVANDYAYITTPYLIIDNDICSSIENASLRGVDVKIILPHVPDKKMVFDMTRSFYSRLIKAGVEIYEYGPGFMHAKNYVVDDKIAMVGTVNLDYRSLAHHFENAVWLYKCDCIKDIKADIMQTLDLSIKITEADCKVGGMKAFFRALLKIFAPLM